MSLLWLVVVPPLVGLIVYPLRKLPWLPALLSAATMLALGYGATQIPENQAMVVLGRPLVLTPLARCLFVPMYGALALLLLHGEDASPGKLLRPVGLLTAGLLAAVMLVQHLAIAALLLELAMILIALIIPSERPTSGQSAMRYLVIVTIAVLPLLIAPWLAELYELDPGNTTYPALIMIATVTGLTVLLGLAPFHIWQSAVAAYAPPHVTAIVAIPLSATIWYRWLDILQRYPWIGNDARVQQLIALLALGSVALGGVLAYAQHRLDRLMGYAAIADFGLIMMATSATGLQVGPLLLYHWLARGLALVLVAMSTSTLQLRLGDTDLDAVRSAARRFPITALGLFVGGLSLAGLPLTGGFMLRWVIVGELVNTSLPQTLAVAASSALIGWSYLRFLIVMLAPPEEPQPMREPLLSSVVVVLSVLLALAMVWQSQTVLSLLANLAPNALEFLTPQ